MRYALLFLALASCAMPTANITQAPYRVEFVKITTPWYRAAHPDAVVTPKMPPPTVEFLRMIDMDPEIRMVEHMDQPAKDSWTKCEVAFDTLIQALVFREMLTREDTSMGEVVQVRILVRGDR